MLSTTENTFTLKKNAKVSKLAARSDVLITYAEEDAAEYAIDIVFGGKNMTVICESAAISYT